MRVLFLIFLILLTIIFLPFSSPAQHAGHQMPGMGGEKKAEPSAGGETSSTRTFLLEDFKASFSIMSMEEDKKMLKEMKMKTEVDPKATHNLAVTLTDIQSNQPIKDAVVKMKVIDPQGKEEIKLLDFSPSMNQYANDFTLTEKGRYQILILFKSGGKKRAAGFYYGFK